MKYTSALFVLLILRATFFVSRGDISDKQLYDRYLSHLPYQPSENYYVRGTLKKWTDKKGTEYYFIKDVNPDKAVL